MDRKQYMQACTCNVLADQLVEQGPFEQFQDLLAAARDIWWQQARLSKFVRRPLMITAVQRS